MSKRLRPRYHRITALLLSVGVSLLTLLAGLGVIGSTAASSAYAASSRDPGGRLGAPHADRAVAAALDQVEARPSANPPSAPTVAPGPGFALPANSGHGRRVVFAMSAQRAWLVGRTGDVERTYLVSGSVTDNLSPGHYAVYSRSRWAVGVDGSGAMQYFVRFTHGDNAAIGFHDIPELHGRPLQTIDQLGTPRSHGCIRQSRADAIRLWHFAPVGTHVDVVP